MMVYYQLIRLRSTIIQIMLWNINNNLPSNRVKIISLIITEILTRRFCLLDNSPSELERREFDYLFLTE